MSTDIKSVIQLLTQDAKLDFFVLDVSQITGTSDPGNIIYFHAGMNQLLQPVVWQGNTYTYFPCTADGFDVSTNGTLPRPKLTMSNVYMAVTALIDTIGGDLTGAKITRKQTYARYLDAVNWPARTNLVNWSEDATHWTATNATAVLGATDARGNALAVTLSEQAVSGGHSYYNQTPGTVTSGQYVTAQIEVKAGTRTQCHFVMSGPFATTAILDVDLSTGKVITSSGCIRYVINKLGDNGWYQLTICAQANAVGNPRVTVGMLLAGNYASYIGSTSGNLVVGRMNVFTPPGDPTVNDSHNALMTVPYQTVGSTYNPNPDSDPTRYLPDEVYFIERKVSEDDVSIQFELSSAIDLEDLQLPRRVVTTNYCSWDQYASGEGCDYVPHTGGYFDANDNPVTDPNADVCGRSVNSCKIRFGANNPLSYGGFPAARSYSY